MMYKLTVVFAKAVTWTFFFKSKQTVKDAYDGAVSNAEAVCFTDDYGQLAYFKPAKIHAVLLDEIAVSTEGGIELALHQMRAQVKAQRAASDDPVLKMAAMTQGVPSGFNLSRKQ